jgi:ubiquinone/menaquinone biosynthesis C-methylase UbiE
MSQPKYVLGSSPRELSRLSLQSQVIESTTERLLREAGIQPGSRVLDLGCGAGDVSILAAKIVGPSGTIVGIDRSAEAIDRAQVNASHCGFRQIAFHVSSLEDFSSIKPFDAVIGRYVLIHQPAPSEFLRIARRHVLAGGVLAFHEIHTSRAGYTEPASCPLWNQIFEWARIACSVGFLANEAAGRMVEYFNDASLPSPKLFAEVPIAGGPDALLYSWGVETVRALLPVMVQQGLVTEEDLSIDTLEDRLRSEAVTMKAQIHFPAQVCAWTKV